MRIGSRTSTVFGGRQEESLQAWYRSLPPITRGPSGASAGTLNRVTISKSPVKTDIGSAENEYFLISGFG